MATGQTPDTPSVGPDEKSHDEMDAVGQVISMSPDEQFAFWTALTAPVELTPAQQALGKWMRGES